MSLLQKMCKFYPILIFFFLSWFWWSNGVGYRCLASGIRTAENSVLIPAVLCGLGIRSCWAVETPLDFVLNLFLHVVMLCYRMLNTSFTRMVELFPTRSFPADNNRLYWWNLPETSAVFLSHLIYWRTNYVIENFEENPSPKFCSTADFWYPKPPISRQ